MSRLLRSQLWSHWESPLLFVHTELCFQVQPSCTCSLSHNPLYLHDTAHSRLWKPWVVLSLWFRPSSGLVQLQLVREGSAVVVSSVSLIHVSLIHTLSGKFLSSHELPWLVWSASLGSSLNIFFIGPRLHMSVHVLIPSFSRIMNISMVFRTSSGKSLGAQNISAMCHWVLPTPSLLSWQYCVTNGECMKLWECPCSAFFGPRPLAILWATKIRNSCWLHAIHEFILLDLDL